MPEPIALEGVWKTYGRGWVIRGVSARFAAGDFVALVGDNGSGKTTLLKIMAGLLKPTRGKVLIFGESPFSGDWSYKSKVGVAMHDSLLYDELTVLENLNFHAKLRGYEDFRESEMARRAFKEFGLEAYLNARAAFLSHGWRKRADIVRALIGDPEVLLLDEPLSGLDEKALKTISSLLASLERVTVVITSPSREPLQSLLEAGVNVKVVTVRDGVLVW